MQGGVQVSPWNWSAADYVGKKISISVSFDNSTKAISGAVVTHEAGCLYHRIYVDVPNSGTDRVLICNDGSTQNFTKQQLAAGNLNTIDDILALNITAGP